MRRPTRTTNLPETKDAGSAELAYWRMQEEAPPPDHVLHGHYWEDRAIPPKDRLPSGWWILPLILVGSGIWVALGIAVLL